MFNGIGKFTFSDGKTFTGMFIHNVLDSKISEEN
jgi:hypothetical protein